MPLTLLGSSPAEVAAAQRDVARIGIDQVQAAAAGGPMHGQAASPWPAIRSPTSPAMRGHSGAGSHPA